MNQQGQLDSESKESTRQVMDGQNKNVDINACKDIIIGTTTSKLTVCIGYITPGEQYVSICPLQWITTSLGKSSFDTEIIIAQSYDVDYVDCF